MEERYGRGQPLSDADEDLNVSISSDILFKKETLAKKKMQQRVELENSQRLKKYIVKLSHNEFR